MILRQGQIPCWPVLTNPMPLYQTVAQQFAAHLFHQPDLKPAATADANA